MLSALGSRLSALILAFALVVGSLEAQLPVPVVPVAGAPPSFGQFSTHDHTITVGVPPGMPEVWADVKTPGDGRTYSVGIIELPMINPAIAQPRFSSSLPHVPAVVMPPTPAQAFTISAGVPQITKQVVIVQCRGQTPQSVGPNADQDIVWQHYWYGDSGFSFGPAHRKSTNVRAVSVWPVSYPVGHPEEGQPDRLGTRVAICGETFDSVLPNNQYDGLSGWQKIDGDIVTGSTTGLNAWGFGLANGYIAVFDGTGTFLWSHQFYFDDVGGPGTPHLPGACAITDLSIRVEEVVDGGVSFKRDVVTYCGISSFGNQVAYPTASLAPKLPFLAPSTGVAGYVPAAGDTNSSDTNQGDRQWDGIVGRISNLHAPIGPAPLGSTVVKEFHSIVGGREQDGLWGIAELPDDRFVVVGSTTTLGVPGIGNTTFPFTQSQVNWNGQATYCVGVVMCFDAAPTRLTQRLLLEWSFPVGHPSSVSEAHLADVCVQMLAHDDSNGLRHRIAVAGVTNDPAIGSSLPSPSPFVAIPYGQAVTPPPTTDGFVLIGHEIPAGGVAGAGSWKPENLAFQGAVHAGGYRGVGVWNEFLDHVYTVGWQSTGPATGPSNRDVVAAAYFVDTTQAPTAPLVVTRTALVSAPGDEDVAVVGADTALLLARAANPNVDLPYHLGNLGRPEGGGVAVDERARVNVVGSTDAFGFPTNGAPYASFYKDGVDAVRTVVDMLPPNVGRTDRTGEMVHGGASIPAPLPGSGILGGTSPVCALLPFGIQVPGPGASLPGVQTLRRMLIDWDGPAPSATPGFGSTPPPPAIH